MYGYELLKARRERRLELRRAASAQQAMTGGAPTLDVEELLYAASGGDMSSRGVCVKRALVVRGLLQLGHSVEEIAHAWHRPVEDIERDRRRELVDRSGIADEIERQVVELVPESPEPGRVMPVDERVYPYSARAEAESPLSRPPRT